MALVSMMRFAGDADELAAKVHDHVAPVSARLGEKHGNFANIVARTGDGILVVNLWESEEGRAAMAAEPELQEAVRASGMPPPELEAFEVVSLRISERAAGSRSSSEG